MQLVGVSKLIWDNYYVNRAYLEQVFGELQLEISQWVWEDHYKKFNYFNNFNRYVSLINKNENGNVIFVSLEKVSCR